MSTITRKFNKMTDAEQAEVRKAHLVFQKELIEKMGVKAIEDQRFSNFEAFCEEYLKPEPVKLTDEMKAELLAKGWSIQRYKPQNGEESDYLVHKDANVKGGFLNMSSVERLRNTAKRLEMNLAVINAVLAKQ